MTLRPIELGLLLEDAADSGALTRIVEVPFDLAVAESRRSTAMPTPPMDLSIDEAYRRFIAIVKACDAVHGEVDAVFGALRDLQPMAADQSTAALERVNDAWRRLDDEIPHLSPIAPRYLDAVSSMTADLYQVLRQILARGLVFQGEQSAQFRAEADALAERLARHDRYARAQQEHPR